MKFTTRQRLLASTLLIGAAAMATPAWAQTGTDESAEPPITSEADADAAQNDPGAPTGAEADSGESIIVTGSRVPRRDLTSTSPLTVVQDEEFSLTGSATVENVLNSLPQIIPATTSFSNNPGGGVATLNLRGLGTQRNLVLVNGRRYMFFDASQVTDLNTIPSFLLDSVDVVTGGASAVYGSDALAGVTNFHLRNDLNGMIAGGTYSLTEQGDGARYNVYAAIGTEFGDGRGNVTIYGEFYNRGEIFQNARDFSAFAFNDGTTGGAVIPGSGHLVRGGSSSVPQGRIQVIGGTRVAGAGGNCDPTAGPVVNCIDIGAGTNYAGSGAFFAVPGDSVAYTGGSQAYNYAPSNYLMVPGKRWTLGGYGEYEVHDAGHTVYGEAAFVNNRVDNELAATPIGQPVVMDLATVCATISVDDCNQLTTIAARQQTAIAAGSTVFPAGLAADQVALNVNYRFTQIANRLSLDDRNAFRLLGGIRGPITENLNYDLYYSYARTKNAQIQLGNVSRSAFITNVEDGTCDVFGLNQLSDECIANTSIDAQNQEESVLQVAQGSISGTAPFTFQWANDAIGFAVGAEWRSMSANFRPDTALASGDVVGFNAGDPTQGQYDAKELFGEIRLPIVQDNFIHRFEINGAYRLSNYSLDAVGTVHTYAVGTELAPVPDIAFRAQYQRAIRAPNVGELFGGAAVGFPGADDPCSNRTAVEDRTPALRAACIANGVPASEVFSSTIQTDDQIEGAFGGNPNLSEETGDTYTLGVVIRPRWVPRLNIAVDWYNIKIQDAIAVAGGSVQGVLDACLLQGATAFCSLINRDPATGELSGNEFIVTANNQNLAQLNAEGFDWQLDYNHPIGFGLMGPTSRLSLGIQGNYTYRSSFVAYEGAEEIECAGKFAGQCGEPTPKWKWTSRLSWMDGPLTTSVRWRHLSKVDDQDGNNAVLEMDSYDLFDLAFAFDVTDNATLSIGVNNLFDKKPPIVGANAEQANTYPSTYDVLGRDFFVSASFRL